MSELRGNLFDPVWVDVDPGVVAGAMKTFVEAVDAEGALLIWTRGEHAYSVGLGMPPDLRRVTGTAFEIGAKAPPERALLLWNAFPL